MTAKLHTPKSIMRTIVPDFLLLGLLTLMIQGCTQDGSENPDQGAAGNNGTSYLTVSHRDVYFGTREVGAETSQKVTLTNQSADVYPINSIAVSGAGASEFSLDYDKNGMTLNPGEQLLLAVNFLPLTEGRKYSKLDIDHDIIARASDAKNQLEQKYYKARELEQYRRFDESLDEYREYVASDPAVANNKRRANTRVPVLTESTRQSDDDIVRLYTAALDYREHNNSDAALRSLDKLLEEEPQSYLTDDALYLKGYIQLVDIKNYEEAYSTMLSLRFQFPESSYYDTALYVEAIAQQELGDIELAESLFSELRARHTGLSIDLFNMEWPKDNYLSRLWFNRSEEALASLKAAG